MVYCKDIISFALNFAMHQVEISVDGETWTITYKVAVRSMSISFELDQEFEEINPMTGEESKVGFWNVICFTSV